MNFRIWFLTAGNFAIGTSVLLVNGLLDEVAAGLQVSIAVAGQLTTIFAATVAVCGPLLAALTGAMDRRTLLLVALAASAFGSVVSALANDYAVLCVGRIVSALGASMFVPHAATTASLLVTPELRGRAVTIVFAGMVVATVVGVPMSNAIGTHAGWKAAFAAAAVLPAIAAFALWKALPAGLKAPSAGAGVWAALFRSPAMALMLATTALQMAGQLTLFVYVAPWLKTHLQIDSVGVGWVFMAYGMANVLGMIAVALVIDRIGAGRLANAAIALTVAAMAVLPLVQGSLLPCVLVIMLWGTGSLAINASMQARLIGSAPWLATAAVPLNSSAISAGQAVGAIVGAWVISHDGYDRLAWVGAGIVLVSLAVSIAAGRQRPPALQRA